MSEEIKSKPMPKGLVPSRPSTPSPEILAREFNMDTGLLSGDKHTISAPIQLPVREKEGTVDDKKTIIEAPKKDEKEIVQESEKKIEEPKVESEKKVSSILKPPGEKKLEIKEGEKKAEVPIKITLPEKKDARDYTGFSQEEVSILKQMSNPAFDYASKIIKEHKELSKTKADVFLQHPDAFTLSPEYNQMQRGVYLAGVEAQYWQDALMKCTEGNTFKELKSFDENGNPVFGPEVQPNQQIEEMCRLSLMKCQTAYEQRSGQLQAKSQGFRQQYQNDLGAIQRERSLRFPWAQDPKLLDYTVNIEGVGDKSIKQIREDITNLFPPYMRGHPGVEVASDLMVAMIIQRAELNEARSGKQIAEVRQQEILRGEPSSESKPLDASEGEVHGVRTFSVKGMPD